MDATRAIQDSIHVFSLVRKYVSRILGTYHILQRGMPFKFSVANFYLLNKYSARSTAVSACSALA